MTAYVSSLNQRQQVTFSAANASVLYPSTIGGAQWRMQVRESSVPGAPILLDSADGLAIFSATPTPVVTFRWPTSEVADIAPAQGCAFDFGFILPGADFEVAGWGTVTFVSGITEAGVEGSPAAPAGADDTWALVGAPAPQIVPSVTLQQLLAALQPTALLAALLTLDSAQLAPLEQALSASLQRQTGATAPVPTGEEFVNSDGFEVIAQ